jgi:CubicO group peptidase (beta-lactamase class C family)
VELIRDDFLLEDVVRTESVTVEDILSHRSGMPRREFIFSPDYNLQSSKLFHKIGTLSGRSFS